MDDIDRKICEIVQREGRSSSAELAAAVGVSVSTANERVRKLTASGVVAEWRAVLEPEKAGAGLCAFVLIDMRYEGEEAACAILTGLPEVLELHHVSGPHSYLAKIRVRDTASLQRFLSDEVKPLAAIQRTESILSLDVLKETSAVKITAAGEV